ncbi:MAG: hypothetical protein VXW00_08835, partial [Candidatus Latescibacterota bacterium]|nr:hypothetical protein [Candidatus Latescibacterota bacterium]
MLQGPNREMLEAQARVCTGPHQSRPLGKREDDLQPAHMLELVFQSLRGDLVGDERVSTAQMGAFFAAMCIRRGFGEKTGWSVAEHAAFDRAAQRLNEMPKTLQFILRGEGEPEALSGEERVVAALSDILQGRHLDYDRTLHALRDILDGKVRPELTAALLIGQRMNIEDGEEVRAYLDAVLPAEAALGVDVDSLTHFGQPFDGARRYFRPTLFVAAVRAALGRPTVLHGVGSMPPKNGVTEEQILEALGAHTGLSP